MKTITLHRSDFRKTAEADFFDDLLFDLGVPVEKRENIHSIEFTVTGKVQLMYD